MKNIIKWAALMCAVIFVAVGCSAGDDSSGEDEWGEGDSSSEGYAPQSLSGKSLVSSKLVNTYNFSSSSMSIKFKITLVSLEGTPSYTYTKTDDNTARLTMRYNTLMTVGKDWTRGDYTLNIVMNFTTPTTGTLTCEEKYSSTSNKLKPTNSTRTYTDSFTLN